jgi:hypothetical protein
MLYQVCRESHIALMVRLVMKDKANNPQSFVKMEKARRLMDQGYYQESLVLALEALLQELDNLQSSLLALQTTTRPELSPPAPTAREEHLYPDTYWLPAIKPRVLH